MLIYFSSGSGFALRAWGSALWASTPQDEVDPLKCPKCSGAMKVISVIEDEEIVKKILKHLGLWDQKARPPPRTGALEPNVRIDTSDSQVPPCEDYLYCDPEYPIEAYAS